MGWSPGDCLSLGFAVAANLGWKLASVIRGEMPESLLDTYNAERRPVAEAVLEYEVTGSRDSWLRLLARLGYFEPLRKGEQAPPIVR